MNANYGAEVDFVAVGTNVFSTYKKNATGQWQYMVASGTSMAAAVISGVAHYNGLRPKPLDAIPCIVVPRRNVPGDRDATPPIPINYAFGIRNE